MTEHRALRVLGLTLVLSIAASSPGRSEVVSLDFAGLSHANTRVAPTGDLVIDEVWALDGSGYWYRHPWGYGVWDIQLKKDATTGFVGWEGCLSSRAQLVGDRAPARLQRPPDAGRARCQRRVRGDPRHWRCLERARLRRAARVPEVPHLRVARRVDRLHDHPELRDRWPGHDRGSHRERRRLSERRLGRRLADAGRHRFRQRVHGPLRRHGPDRQPPAGGRPDQRRDRIRRESVGAHRRVTVHRRDGLRGGVQVLGIR